MDTNKYENTMEYPARPSSKNERAMDVYKAEVAKYRAEEARLLGLFEADLYEEYLNAPQDTKEAAELQKKRKVIFQKAWADGHAGGLYDVETNFRDLLDFARELGVNI